MGLWTATCCTLQRASQLCVLFCFGLFADYVIIETNMLGWRKAPCGLVVGTTILPLLFSLFEGEVLNTAFDFFWLTSLSTDVWALLKQKLRTRNAFCTVLLLNCASVAVGTPLSLVLFLPSLVFMWLCLPNTFTMGEAAICCQFWCFLLHVATTLFFHEMRLTKLQTVIVLGLFGPILYAASTVFVCHMLSKQFQLVHIFAGIVACIGTLWWISLAIEQSSLVWLWEYMTSDGGMPLKLSGFFVAILAVMLPLTPTRFEQSQQIIVRKYFHLIGVVMFLPGVLLHAHFMCLAFAVSFSILLVLEALRIARVPPVASLLDQAIAAYLDTRDQGTMVLTHIYLLLGCALPVWHAVFCHRDINSARGALVALAGCTVVGVGDAVASCVGVLYGRTRWPGTHKTVEGSVAMLLSMLLFQASILFYTGSTMRDGAWVRLFFSDVLACLLEGCTDQIDNLVVPLYHVALLQMI